jgi:ribosomal-protein-alanine N-acetyltransferase
MWPFASKSAPPVIRRLTSDHAVEAARIHASAFHRGWSASEIANLANDASVLAHVALDSAGREVLGFSMARHAASEAEILTIVIDGSKRQRGLGAALLAAQVKALEEFGVKEIFLEVDGQNAPALALYARFGFVKVGERKAYYARPDGPPASALIMKRGEA